MSAARFLLIDIAEVQHDDHFDGVAGLIGPMPDDEAHALAQHVVTHKEVLRVHVKDMSLNDTHVYVGGEVVVPGRREAQHSPSAGLTVVHC